MTIEKTIDQYRELLTTRRFIEMLQEQDPDGDRVIVFDVRDEDDTDITVAVGDVYASQIDLFLKYARQTQEGDQDALRIRLPLDCSL